MPQTGQPVSQAATDGKAAGEVAPSSTAIAEDCFNQSIRIAQQQKAKSLELRAALSMARLYRNQGKQHETRSLLTQIYNSFTEGFDTVDLREAKALLDELSKSSADMNGHVTSLN